MWPFGKKEERASIEDPRVPITQESFASYFNVGAMTDFDVNVTIDEALGVAAFWAGVNFLSGTIAGLPLNTFKKTDSGREKVGDGIHYILHDAVNDEMTSFDWRKYFMERTLTAGRGPSFIERNIAGRVINIWPLDPNQLTVKKVSGRKVYLYRDGNRVLTYYASDVIDITFMLASDGITAKSPVFTNKNVFGASIAATKYSAKYFQDGGVPPFWMSGTFETGRGLENARKDLEKRIKESATERRKVLTLPMNHTIGTLGVDPQKSQMVETHRFAVEEIARILSLPPVFLQDLTRGTFSNTEQQDLHLVKHTVKRWVEQIEQELNLKLFGRHKNKMYVEFNLDGLLRGDFKTRMDGYATGVQNAILTPNECRDMENRGKHEKGDDLMIQGATVPLGTQPNTQQSGGPSDDGGI